MTDIQKIAAALARAADFMGEVHHGEWAGPTDRRDKVVAEVESALSLARSMEKEQGWMTIETAPKDRWLLVAGPKARTSAYAMVALFDGNGWESADDGYHTYMNPTHWRELPPPPSGVQP